MVEVAGGGDLTDPDAEILFGSVTDEKMAGAVKLTIIAVEFE